MSNGQSKCIRCGKVSEFDAGVCKTCLDAEQATIAPTPALDQDATIVPGKTSAAMQTEKSVGDYDLIEEIARGGMGVVYKANHRNLNRVSAVKMILGGRFSSEEELQRFRIEAESAAKLDHPAIVPIFEIGEHEGQAFFAMKYVDGGSLADKATSFTAKPRDAANLMVKVAEGVHHAHQRGILHRDLKPANILIDLEGEPFVTDLGLAKSTTGGSDLTHTGAVLGTPSYMPPEQASGKSVTTAADVYSLGAIFYELLVGRAPYKGDTTVSVVMQVVDGPPDLPQKINPAIDRDLELICLKAMAREPADRYTSAQAMADDLKSWLAGDTISVRPPSVAARFSLWLKKNQSLAYGVFAVAIGVLICTPIVLTFFSDNLGNVYDHFPEKDRPWMFRIWVPNLISFFFALLLFLIIWPSIGFLNAVISKPPTITRSLTSGFRISAILSLIFYVLVGWMIVIQGVNNYSRTNIGTVVEAVWPNDETTPEAAMEKANSLFGGLESIPESDRAAIVIKRLRADCYASIPYSLGIGLLAIVVFAGPIIYGTVIASSLGRRGLPVWLVLLRYLIAWWTISVLLLCSFLLAMTFASGVELRSNRIGVVIAYVIMVLVIFLSLRRWKKEPKMAVTV